MPTIRVDGMTCQHCVATVAKALERIEGVTNVRVDLDSGTATYEQEGSVDAAAIRTAIEGAGYTIG